MNKELWEIAESLQEQAKGHYANAEKGKGKGFNAEGMGAVAESITGLVLINISVAIKKSILEAKGG